MELAETAGVRYSASFAGRPAVLVALHDHLENTVLAHGRYLSVLRGQEKMFTVGPGGGTINLLGGWRVDPLIIAEGLFDALSLAVCGFACIATIGRWASWLPEVAAGRTVWLAFDNGRPGEAEAARYAALLSQSEVKRIFPPGRSKDWNTALMKLGRSTVVQCVQDGLNKTI
jgi:hypothetical protein